jgi:hypothetical protein
MPKKTKTKRAKRTTHAPFNTNLAKARKARAKAKEKFDLQEETKQPKSTGKPKNLRDDEYLAEAINKITLSPTNKDKMPKGGLGRSVFARCKH